MSTDRKTRAEAAQETSDRLVLVALSAFAERGFADISLDALAARAGVTRGALHHRFGNKSGLFEAVLRRIDRDVAAEMDRVWRETLDHWQGYRACFHGFLDTALHPDRSRILLPDAPRHWTTLSTGPSLPLRSGPQKARRPRTAAPARTRPWPRFSAG